MRPLHVQCVLSTVLDLPPRLRSRPQTQGQWPAWADGRVLGATRRPPCVPCALTHPLVPPCLGRRVPRLLVAPTSSGCAPGSRATPGSVLGAGAPQGVSSGLGPFRVGAHRRAPSYRLPQGFLWQELP